MPTVAPFGPFVSKNHFAGYVELAALLAVGLATGLADEARHGDGWLSWIDSRRAKWVVVAWGAAFVLVLAVPVSLSRGGVVSLTAGLRVLRPAAALGPQGLTALGPAASSWRSAGLGVAGLLLVAVLPRRRPAPASSPSPASRATSPAPTASALWRDTLRLAASSPAVGSGFGAYEDALPRFKTTAGDFRVQHAENDHLELLAEGGLLAALLGAAAVLALLLLGLKALRADGAPPRPVSPRRRARRRSRGLRPHRLRLQPPHPVERADGGASRGASCASAILPAAKRTETTRREASGRPRVAVLLAVSLLTALATPWSEPRWDPATLARATAPTRTDLRRSALESDVTALLRRRPAQAPAWVHLGWLRLPDVSRRRIAPSRAGGWPSIPATRSWRGSSAPLSRDARARRSVAGRLPIARHPRPGRIATTSKPTSRSQPSTSSRLNRPSIGATSRSNCSDTTIRNGTSV